MHTVPDERPPWWRRLADFADDNYVCAAFAIMTAVAAAGYVAGYRDGAGECSR